MVAINKVMLAGNLTRDPETRTVNNERIVCSFSLAINRRYKSADGEPREEVTFVDCEAWGRTAELVGQYLTKGSSAHVEGRLKLDTWEKDGVRQSRLRVVAESVQFLGGRPASQEQEEAPVGGRAAPAATSRSGSTAAASGRPGAARPSGPRGPAPAATGRTRQAAPVAAVEEDEPPF